MNLGIPALIIFSLILIAGDAAGYGSSKEDLVGVFSLQKAIKIGSSSECFSAQGEVDTLNSPFNNLEPGLLDEHAPIMAKFFLDPNVVSTNVTIVIDFTAHIIDDQSGFYSSEGHFCSPSGNQGVDLIFDNKNLTSGTSKDGFYTGKVRLRPKMEKGIWKLEKLAIADKAGNQRILNKEDLLQLGSAAELRVV